MKVTEEDIVKRAKTYLAKFANSYYGVDEYKEDEFDVIVTEREKIDDIAGRQTAGFFEGRYIMYARPKDQQADKAFGIGVSFTPFFKMGKFGASPSAISADSLENLMEKLEESNKFANKFLEKGIFSERGNGREI